MADLIRDYGNRDYSQICEMIYHSQKYFYMVQEHCKEMLQKKCAVSFLPDTNTFI